MREDATCPRTDGCKPLHCQKINKNFVQDDEPLLRMELCPEHYDRKKGFLKDAAFAQSQFVTSGYSVDRKFFCTKETYDQRIKIMNSMKKRRNEHVEKIGCATAKDIRHISLNDTKVFLLCPSSSPKRPSHADIFTRNTKRYSPSRWNDIRDQLRQIFKLTNPENVFME